MWPLPNGDAFPRGDLRYVYLHWTAGDYGTVYDAYHLCVGYAAAGPFVAQARDLRANMRDVRAARGYAAHTAGRNSYAAGLAACGMLGATPHDFGSFPLRDDVLALLCLSAARLCAFYAIPVDAEHVLTHAEAALQDGYFGSGDLERWDIARFAASSEPLCAREAAEAGAELRARIRAAS